MQGNERCKRFGCTKLISHAVLAFDYFTKGVQLVGLQAHFQSCVERTRRMKFNHLEQAANRVHQFASRVDVKLGVGQAMANLKVLHQIELSVKRTLSHNEKSS